MDTRIKAVFGQAGFVPADLGGVERLFDLALANKGATEISALYAEFEEQVRTWSTRYATAMNKPTPAEKTVALDALREEFAGKWEELKEGVTDFLYRFHRDDPNRVRARHFEGALASVKSDLQAEADHRKAVEDALKAINDAENAAAAHGHAAHHDSTPVVDGVSKVAVAAIAIVALILGALIHWVGYDRGVYAEYELQVESERLAGSQKLAQCESAKKMAESGRVEAINALNVIWSGTGIEWDKQNESAGDFASKVVSTCAIGQETSVDQPLDEAGAVVSMGGLQFRNPDGGGRVLGICQEPTQAASIQYLKSSIRGKYIFEVSCVAPPQ